MKFTEGKWFVGTEDQWGFNICGEDGYHVLKATSRIEENYGNAVLAASAPELLQALKDLIPYAKRVEYAVEGLPDPLITATDLVNRFN